MEQENVISPAMRQMAEYLGAAAMHLSSAQSGSAEKMVSGIYMGLAGAIKESAVANDLAPLWALFSAAADFAAKRPSPKNPGKTIGDVFYARKARRDGTNN